MEKPCPRCDKRVAVSDASCDACGLVFPPPPPPKCPGCGRTVHPESDVCGFCGLELRAPSSEPAAGATATVSLSLSSLLWPVIGLVLIGGYLKNRKQLNPLAQINRPPPKTAPAPAEAPPSEAPAPSIGHVLPTDVPEAGMFRLDGEVFDVVSLKAVADATVVFHNPDTNDYYGARTDDRGRYSAYLAAVTAGYIVTIQHERYGSVYIVDWTPSIRELNEASRRYVIADLRSGQTQPEQIFGLPDGKMVKSFAVLPR